MGHHYVPQAHLRRFQIEEQPGRIWMYDKQDHVWRIVSTKTAAQNAEYYADDVEASLANEVEAPGNKIVRKLLRSDPLTSEERFDFAQYINIMATRGPRQRRKSFEAVPEVLNSTTSRLRLELGLLRNRHNGDRVDARLEEIDRVKEKFQTSLPQNLIDQIRVPFCSFDMVKAIYDMAWHVVRSPEHHFITGDTPAHFFESIGTTNRHSVSAHDRHS